MINDEPLQQEEVFLDSTAIFAKKSIVKQESLTPIQLVKIDKNDSTYPSLTIRVHDPARSGRVPLEHPLQNRRGRDNRQVAHREELPPEPRAPQPPDRLHGRLHGQPLHEGALDLAAAGRSEGQEGEARELQNSHHRHGGRRVDSAEQGSRYQNLPAVHVPLILPDIQLAREHQ